ncbi:MAG: hypothetical protein V3S66_01065 [Desulfobacterales bacterium]
MAEKRIGGRAGIVFLVLIPLLYLVSGCSTLRNWIRPATPQQTRQAEDEAAPLYYDFGDILLPRELKVDKKASFVFRTPGLSAGVLALKGRVEGGSLIAFFENNMAKDNWQPVSSFKSPRTMMLFKKENRWCVINITEKEFNTHVEVWVAPTIAQGVSGLIK